MNVCIVFYRCERGKGGGNGITNGKYIKQKDWLQSWITAFIKQNSFIFFARLYSLVLVFVNNCGSWIGFHQMTRWLLHFQNARLYLLSFDSDIYKYDHKMCMKNVIFFFQINQTISGCNYNKKCWYKNKMDWSNLE